MAQKFLTCNSIIILQTCSFVLLFCFLVLLFCLIVLLFCFLVFLFFVIWLSDVICILLNSTKISKPFASGLILWKKFTFRMFFYFCLFFVFFILISVSMSFFVNFYYSFMLRKIHVSSRSYMSCSFIFSAKNTFNSGITTTNCFFLVSNLFDWILDQL